MSSYSCPGCGQDAPLAQECQRCEVEPLEHSAWPGDELRASLKRLAATRSALRESLSSHAETVASLLTAREELQLALTEAETLRGEAARLRAETHAANRRSQGESRSRLRARAELRLLRERLAEYERPVDDQALAEIMYRVEAEHAQFAAAERGEGAAGFASWCGNCETFILVIRKMAAAARPAADRASMLGRSVKTCADRVGRVIEQPVDRSAPAGSEFLQIPAHSVGTIVRASSTAISAEFSLYGRKLVAEFRLGDVEILPLDVAAAP